LTLFLKDGLTYYSELDYSGIEYISKVVKILIMDKRQLSHFDKAPLKIKLSCKKKKRF